MRRSNRHVRRAAAGLAVAAALGLGAGCGGSDDGGSSTLGVEIFGWTESSGWQTQMPPFAEQQPQYVHLKMTRPDRGQLVAESLSSFAERSGQIPDVDSGDGLRLDLEVLDANLEPIATGATPIFDYGADSSASGFRIMVSPVDAFAPVGSIVRDPETGLPAPAQSQFDPCYVKSIGGYCQATAPDANAHLGRIGHATAATDRGNEALVVGGADVATASAPGTIPTFRRLHGDVQHFDSASGYFTDLSYDTVARQANMIGQDRLNTARAYHTVTPIGQDRFVVIGGIAVSDAGTFATKSIEVIDLNAPAGQRIQVAPTELINARALHTATYRPADNTIVIAGGVGRDTQGALDSVEYLDLNSWSVRAETSQLSQARAEHEAVLMGDGSTIWFIGGRAGGQALAGTELLRLGDGGVNTVVDAGAMAQPRFGAGAVRMTPGRCSGTGMSTGCNVIVIGGYTSLEGDVANTYEISIVGRGEWLSNSAWTLASGRGGVVAVEMPQTQRIAVVGGRDSSGSAVKTGEILAFQGLSATAPYTAQLSANESVNARADATATLLGTGRVLVVGGMGRKGQVATSLDNAEYFNVYDPIGGQP